MPFKGAGGTSGGIGTFFIGVLMFVLGLYLLLKNIYVYNNFSLSMRFYNWGGVSITSGIIMIPFMIGLGMVFYNYKNWIGWLLFAGSLVLMIVGVITSTQFTLASMTAFDLIVILVLLVGGLGLLLRSFKNSN
jgi:uncharacterized protein